MSGVRRLIASKSSRSSATPASRAIASRCSTALVDPPVAATPAMAFSSAARVRIVRGVRPAAIARTATSPACLATAARAWAVAGTFALPIGEIPRNSQASAIVLAVNCPPHAPAPGHAPPSRSFSPSSESRPAECAPTASNTS